MYEESVKIPCPTCDGSGNDHSGISNNGCWNCQGNGFKRIKSGERNCCPHCEGRGGDINSRSFDTACPLCNGLGFLYGNKDEVWGKFEQFVENFNKTHTHKMDPPVRSGAQCQPEKTIPQTVNGRRCDRSINDMESAALNFINEEVRNHFGNNALVALLSDYIRMGREYGDMMNTDSRNLKNQILKLQQENYVLRTVFERLSNAAESAEDENAEDTYAPTDELLAVAQAVLEDKVFIPNCAGCNDIEDSEVRTCMYWWPYTKYSNRCAFSNFCNLYWDIYKRKNPAVEIHGCDISLFDEYEKMREEIDKLKGDVIKKQNALDDIYRMKAPVTGNAATEAILHCSEMKERARKALYGPHTPEQEVEYTKKYENSYNNNGEQK